MVGPSGAGKNAIMKRLIAEDPHLERLPTATTREPREDEQEGIDHFFVAREKFAEWHKAVFDRQDEENGGWGNMSDVIALTRSIEGIDVAKVEALATGQAADYQQEMQADAQEGSAMGVGGTPSFLIGKQMLVGVQPFGSMKAAIDEELKR